MSAMLGIRVLLLSAVIGVAIAAPPAVFALAAGEVIYPGATWAVRSPQEVGLDATRLNALRDLVGGRGCVVRHGYMVYTWGDPAQRGDVASAAKPLYGHLLLKALEDKRLASLDAPVMEFEPRLAPLNAALGFKDRHITWRHLANQISCYGVGEQPGAAFDYNDFQMALLFDTLFLKVYRTTWQHVDRAVLHPLLTDALQCQDDPTFMAFGPDDRPGRLAISVRDFARFGLLYLRAGRWRDRQLLSPEHARMATTSPLPNTILRTAGQAAEMIPGQRSIGSLVVPDNQCDHLGSYSWLWWTNGVDRDGQRHWPGTPTDAYGAFGHAGVEAMVVAPSLDLIVSWNETRVDNRELEGRALSTLTSAVQKEPAERRTEVSICGEAFEINGRPTYAGRVWQGHRIEGLLLNSRMVQAIFDDLNPETRQMWVYPDTGTWDPERNTDEFIAAMSEWRRHGLLAFTLDLQGGTPREGTHPQPWENTALTATGELRPEYMARLQRVLDRADELGMVAILGIFYFGQDQRLQDEKAVVRAVDNSVDWVLAHGYRNVLAEINNECNAGYEHAILQPGRVHELIERAKARERAGRRLLVSTSYGGGTIPEPSVVRSADFLLLHGNGVGNPERIANMVDATRRVPGYRPMPILFNEDDHYAFDQPRNNLVAAVERHCSWGYLDMGSSGYRDGYQAVPVNWGINTERKRAFFAKVKEITGE